MKENTISKINGREISRSILLMILSILMISLSVSSVNATSLKIPSDITYYGNKLMLIGGQTYSFNATYADYKETYFSIGLSSRYERGIVGLDWKKKNFIVEPKVTEIGKETTLTVTGVKVVDGKNVEEDIGEIKVLVVNECEGKGPIGGMCMDTQKYYCGSPANSKTLLTSSGCDSAHKSISSAYFVSSGDIKCCPATFGAPVQHSSKSRKVQILKPSNFNENVFALYIRYSSWFGLVNDDKPYDPNTDYKPDIISVVVKSKTSSFTGEYKIDGIDLSIGSGIKYVTLTKDFLSSFKYASFRVEMVKFAGDTNSYEICFDDNKCWKINGLSSTFTDIPLSYTRYYLKGRELQYYFDYNTIQFPVLFQVSDDKCKVEFDFPEGCDKLTITTDKQPSREIDCDQDKYDDFFNIGEKFLTVSGSGFFDYDLGYTCSPTNPSTYYKMDLKKMRALQGRITIESIPALLRSHIRTFVTETRTDSCPDMIGTGNPNVNGKLQKNKKYCVYLCSDYYAGYENNYNCYKYLPDPEISDGREQSFNYVDENIQFKFPVTTNDPQEFNLKNLDHRISGGIVVGKMGDTINCDIQEDDNSWAQLSVPLSNPTEPIICAANTPTNAYGHFVLGGTYSSNLEIASVVSFGGTRYIATDNIPRGTLPYTINIKAKCIDAEFSVTGVLDSAEKVIWINLEDFQSSIARVNLAIAAYRLGDYSEPATTGSWSGTVANLNDFWSQETGRTATVNTAGVETTRRLTYGDTYARTAVDYSSVASNGCKLELSRSGAGSSNQYYLMKFYLSFDPETVTEMGIESSDFASSFCSKEGDLYECGCDKDSVGNCRSTKTSVRYYVIYKGNPEKRYYTYTPESGYYTTTRGSLPGIKTITPLEIPRYEDVRVSYSESSDYSTMLKFFDVTYEYDISGGARAFTNGMTLPKGKTVTFKLVPKTSVVSKNALSKQERTDAPVSLDLDVLGWSNPTNTMVNARIFSETDYNTLVSKNVRKFRVSSNFKGVSYAEEYDISTGAQVALSDSYKVEIKRGSNYLQENIPAAPYANPIVSSIDSLMSSFNDIKVTIKNKGREAITVAIAGTEYTATSIAAAGEYEFTLVAGTSYIATYTAGTKEKTANIDVGTAPSSIEVNIDSLKDRITYTCSMDVGPCLSSGLSISAPALSGLDCACADMKNGCLVDKGCELKLNNEYLTLYSGSSAVSSIKLDNDFVMTYSLDMRIKSGKSLVFEVTKDSVLPATTPVTETRTLNAGSSIEEIVFSDTCKFLREEVFNGAFAARAPKITKDCRSSAAANLLTERLRPIYSADQFSIKSVVLTSLGSGQYSAVITSNSGKLLSTTPCTLTPLKGSSTRVQNTGWCPGKNTGESCPVAVTLDFVNGYATDFLIQSTGDCMDSALVRVVPGCPASKILDMVNAEIDQSLITSKNFADSILSIALKSGYVFAKEVESGKAKGAEISTPLSFALTGTNTYVRSENGCDFKINYLVAPSSRETALATCDKITFTFATEEDSELSFVSSVVRSSSSAISGVTCTSLDCSGTDKFEVGKTYDLSVTLKDGFAFDYPFVEGTPLGARMVKLITTGAVTQACTVELKAKIMKTVADLDRCDFKDPVLNSFASMFTVSKSGNSCTISGGCLRASGDSSSIVIDISGNAANIKGQFVTKFANKKCTYTVNKIYSNLKKNPNPCASQANRYELVFNKGDTVDLPAFQLDGGHNPNLAWEGGENCNAADKVFCCKFEGTPSALFYSGTNCEGAAAGGTNPNCIYGAFYDKASCTYDLSKYLTVSGTNLLQLKIPHSLVTGTVDMTNPVVLSFPDLLGTTNSRDITSGSFSSPSNTFTCSESTIFAMLDKGIDAEDPARGLLRYIQLRDSSYYFNTANCNFDATDTNKVTCIPNPKPEKKSQSCMNYVMRKPLCSEGSAFTVNVVFNPESSNVNKNEVVITKEGATFSPDFCLGTAPITTRCVIRQDKLGEVSGTYPCTGLLVPATASATSYCVDSMGLGVTFIAEGDNIKASTIKGKFKDFTGGPSCKDRTECTFTRAQFTSVISAPDKDCSLLMEESSIMLPLGCPVGKPEASGYAQVKTSTPGTECTGNDYEAIRIKSAAGTDSGEKGYCCKPRKECTEYSDEKGSYTLVSLDLKDVYCVQDAVAPPELIKNVAADKICCVRKNICSGSGYGLVKILDGNGEDQISKLCEAGTDTAVPGDTTQKCCKEKTCPGTWVPAAKERDWCEIKAPETAAGEGEEPARTAQDGQTIVFMRKTLTDGKDIVCCQRKTDVNSIVAGLDLHKTYQKGLEHAKQVCDDKIIQEIQTQDDIDCDKEMGDGSAETMAIISACTSECETSLTREGKLKYNDLPEGQQTSSADEYAATYVLSNKESCVKKCHKSKSACSRLDKNRPQVAKEACERAIREDNQHEYNGELMGECIVNGATTDWFPAGFNSYCNGVREGIQEFRRSQRQRSTLAKFVLDSGDTSVADAWIKMIGNIAGLFGGDLGGVTDVNSLYEKDFGSGSMKSFVTPFNNIFMGFRNMSPSVQLNNFCEGKGFYGANWEYPGTRSDSNSLVNLLVSRQKYVDCDATGTSGKEKCNEAGNLSKYIYLFTWQIGGFDQNVSYNIWLTNSNTDDQIGAEDYCFKQYNLSDYNPNSNLKSMYLKNCWNLVLVKGDSHSSQDTLVARFLDTEYKYACVRYRNYETGNAISIPENDDFQSLWGTWYDSSAGRLFGQTQTGDNGNTFVCVEINNNGLGLEDDGDMMGDPYAVYSATDLDNPDDASDEDEDGEGTTATTTSGIR